MKIAICLSGQPRAWKSARDSFKKLIDKIEQAQPGCVIDTFIHTWNFNTKSNIQIDWNHNTPPINGNSAAYATEMYKRNSTILSQDELNEILEFYKPKKYLIETIDKSMKIIYDATSTEDSSPIGWSSSQFYSMQRAAFLKREYELEVGREYDWCIRYRFDLDMNHSDFNIPYISEFSWSEKPATSDIYLARKYNKPKNIVYTSHSGHDSNFWPYYRVGDVCFIADSLTYDLVCNFYDWLLWIPNNLFFHGATPEVVFCYYLNMLRIDMAQLYIDPGVLRDY